MIINMNGAKAPETPSPVLQEKTVTPQTLPTVIGADEGYDGLSQVTINPDSQLKAENIRSGKTIFGVGGTFEGEVKMTGGLSFDYVYAGSDNYGSIVLHRFSADEITTSTDKPTASAQQLKYEVTSAPPSVIQYKDAETNKMIARYSSILTSGRFNASWWGSHGKTPAITIPAQTVEATLENLGAPTVYGERILARFAVGVAQMSSSTSNKVSNPRDVANESVVTLDMEITVPNYGEKVAIDIPQMNFPETQVYNASSPYAVVMAIVSWAVIP